MIVSDAFSPAYASNCAKLCSRQRRTRIHRGRDLFVNGGTSLSSSIIKWSTAHTPIRAIRGESELRLTARESRSRGSGASLDVREGSMLPTTLLPGA